MRLTTLLRFVPTEAKHAASAIGSEEVSIRIHGSQQLLLTNSILRSSSRASGSKSGECRDTGCIL